MPGGPKPRGPEECYEAQYRFELLPRPRITATEWLSIVPEVAKMLKPRWRHVGEAEWHEVSDEVS